MEGGNTFWSPLPQDRCNNDKYSLLYEGKAMKITDKTMPEIQTMYSVESKDMTFALTVKGFENHCGHIFIKSSHPKLLIIETRGIRTPFTAKFTTVKNMDLFLYVNSKFVYVEPHIKKQITQLYLDVVTQRCNLETIKNSLAIAVDSPDQFAYNLIGSGYTAIVAGEVIHIFKCLAVELKIAHGNECYNQLQVLKNNDTWFKTPRTHILLKHGTQIACNNLIPSYYKVGTSWFKVSPKPIETLPPAIINPNTELTWVYQDPTDLANSGIYSESDLQKLREHINFPLEKPALLNSLARGMTGKSTVNQGGTLLNLFNQEEIEQLAEGARLRLWQKFWNSQRRHYRCINDDPIIQNVCRRHNQMLYATFYIRLVNSSIRGMFCVNKTVISNNKKRPEEPEAREMEIIERQPLTQSLPTPRIYPRFPQEHPNAPSEKSTLPEGYHSLDTARI